MGNKEDRSDVVIGTRWRRPRGTRVALLIALGVAILGGSAAASYYVDALWFESLGYVSVFWTRLSLQSATFGAFALITFLVVYGVFRALKPDRLGELIGGTILVNRTPVTLPVEPLLNLIGLGLSVAIAAATGASMMGRWMTLALFWEAPHGATLPDAIFGRSLDFYLFTLPASQLIAGWLLLLSVIVCAIAAVFVLVIGSTRILTGRRISEVQTKLWRGLSLSLAAFFLMIAVRTYLGRFERLFQEGTIFAGVTYTDAHVVLNGMLVVCVALVAGVGIAGYAAVSAPRPRWLLAAPIPAIACYLIVAGVQLVCQRLHRRAEPAGARAALHCAQHRNDAARLRARPHRDTRVSCRHRNRGGGTEPITRPRSRTFGYGTGERCRIRCVRFRRSELTTTFQVSTSIDIKSVVQSAR